ncbi:hypothetical protein Q9R19_13745 [Microbacterium sp. ARD32]|uniref:hypothetical protein n=1 Tax=Microbacterium sp. ARD32 TaxID=2962577 RepID=UPI0028812C40|nr:hypothetical protein [Microbacterium sp. ARD32]MDT0158688.1 hypothetical protein [Microbacterium sp. ARD32]
MTDAFPPPIPPKAPAAPPGAYTVPVGGYATSAGAYQVPPEAAASRGTGLIALLLAGLASVAAPIAAGILGLSIGKRAPIETVISAPDGIVWSALTPVRTLVLWLEIAFWSGTVLGILALTLGIVAIVRRRGRPAGISAIVGAIAGPIVFIGLVWLLYGLGGSA